MHSEQAYVLGGSANKGGLAATAAEARSQKKSSPWMPQGPQKLGGDGAVTKWMKPGDAAAAAAAERCLADEKWRLPCTTVVELLLSSSRSQFLVKETRGECDNSFFHFFLPRNFKHSSLLPAMAATARTRRTRKRNMVTWIGICLDIWKMIYQFEIAEKDG